ncbi:hypothetical protein DFH11DRAFT_1636391 [Phellopilus nigrolimitatus]|nr:hypothetical protein DFH11DRAFT_1636391 [Phellopilus nigrolimitatus]
MVINKGLVLVTGASGFVGSNIVALLLAEGYSVRAVARGEKADVLRAAFEGKSIEVVEIADITTGDFTQALKNVVAVIHCAFPFSGAATSQDMLTTAIEGTLNVLRQAFKAGVMKFVLTSSWGTHVNPDLKQQYQGLTFDENSWGNVTKQDLRNNPMWIYMGTKIFVEKAVWKFAAENAALDLACINPPFIYGPFVEGVVPASPAAAGTNSFVYGLISGEPGRALPPFPSPYFVDVRDVALAHVRALDAPKAPANTHKRFLVAGGAFTWAAAAEHLAVVRPELKARLPDTSSGTPLPDTLSKNDVGLAAKMLGLKEYIPWEKTIEDTIDNLLVLEKTLWAKK